MFSHRAVELQRKTEEYAPSPSMAMNVVSIGSMMRIPKNVTRGRYMDPARGRRKLNATAGVVDASEVIGRVFKGGTGVAELHDVTGVRFHRRSHRTLCREIQVSGKIKGCDGEI